MECHLNGFAYFINDADNWIMSNSEWECQWSEGCSHWRNLKQNYIKFIKLFILILYCLYNCYCYIIVWRFSRNDTVTIIISVPYYIFLSLIGLSFMFLGDQVKTKWQHLRDTHRRKFGRSDLPTGSTSEGKESKWNYCISCKWIFCKTPMIKASPRCKRSQNSERWHKRLHDYRKSTRSSDIRYWKWTTWRRFAYWIVWWWKSLLCD